MHDLHLRIFVYLYLPFTHGHNSAHIHVLTPYGEMHFRIDGTINEGRDNKFSKEIQSIIIEKEEYIKDQLDKMSRDETADDVEIVVDKKSRRILEKRKQNGSHKKH